MTSQQIIRHELLMFGKITCFAFAIQTSLQFFSIVPPWMISWLWLPTSLLIVLGLKSDVKFYGNSPEPNVKRKIFTLNLLLFLGSWLVTLQLFHSLKIPPFEEKDPEVAEAAIPGLEAKLLNSKIFDEFGPVRGILMLLLVHLSSVGAMVGLLKVGLLLLEFVLAWIGKTSQIRSPRPRMTNSTRGNQHERHPQG